MAQALLTVEQQLEIARSEIALLKDKLLTAERRIRVLRGNDVLSSASSRGVVIWLKTILADYKITCTGSGSVPRHLQALIETIEGGTS